MSIELKIKSKHLSLEAKVIRFEERKLAKQLHWMDKHDMRNETTRYVSKDPYWSVVNKLASITHHRKYDVCNENRATFLARCFLSGKSYSYAEKSRRSEKEWIFQNKVLPRVLEMIKKYGPYEIRKQINLDDVKEWASYQFDTENSCVHAA